MRTTHGGMETKLVPSLLLRRVLPADPLLLYSSSAARPRVEARALNLNVRWRRTWKRARSCERLVLRTVGTVIWSTVINQLR
jgi:hypothetical protein